MQTALGTFGIVDCREKGFHFDDDLNLVLLPPRFALVFYDCGEKDSCSIRSERVEVKSRGTPENLERRNRAGGISTEPIFGLPVRDSARCSEWERDGIRIRAKLGAVIRDHSAVSAWVIQLNCRAPKTPAPRMDSRRAPIPYHGSN